ncbi:MAG TPA: M48 family metallopeptidase, partial [Thermoanaerobaculia bacterium]|nr:M48 family metallopeptidase [Thermoanaerobaculia bacterium]
ELSKNFRDARPLAPRIFLAAAWVLGAWVALFLVLLGAGQLLSRVALRAAGRTGGVAAGAVTTEMDARLRQIYGWVIASAGIFYYVSLPLLVVAVLATGGGLVYAAFAFGHVPVKLVVIVVVLTFVSVGSIFKSLFVKRVDEEPGVKVDLDKEARLRVCLDDVAAKVGTRPVESVYLTPGTDVAVFERGSLLSQARGASERSLLLGVGVLPGFRLGPFRAVLAHEYGHFSHRDTAGGQFALAVRRSILTMARHLAEGGAAHWYNPAWLFVNGFHRVFLRISQGASRLQEVLADRWAALTYGAAAFEEGLRHVIARAVAFDAHVGATLREVVEGEEPRPLANLYRYEPKEPPKENEVQEKVDEALRAQASPYDSHPAPAERFAWARALSTGSPSRSADDGDEAWSLFSDREALEKRLTDDVRTNILKNHGVAIPASS